MRNLTQHVTETDNLCQLRSTLPASLKTVDIQHMSQAGLLTLQRHFGLGSEWGTIVFPSKWVPESRRARTGIVSLEKTFKFAVKSEDDLNLAITTATRMALLCLSAPSKVSRKRHAILLSPTTILDRLPSWIRLLKTGLSRPPLENGGLLGRLARGEFRSHEGLSREMKRFAEYTSRGLWWDTPPNDVDRTTLENSNRGPGRKLVKQKTQNPYLPLPDTLVHSVGQRAAWITENLVPTVLDAMEELIELNRGWTSMEQWANSRTFLEQYRWSSPNGEPLNTLPFEIYTTRLKGPHAFAWPPKNWSQLLRFVEIGQGAHFFISALSLGPRASELLSFRTDNVVESRDGIPLANGRTYKIVDPVEGAARDWPLPELAVEALHQQTRLSNLISASRSIVHAKSALLGVNTSLICKCLNEMGMSKTWLAREIQASDSRILSRWEAAGRIHKKWLPKLAKALEVPIHALVLDEALQFLAEDEKIPQQSTDGRRPKNDGADARQAQPLWRVISPGRGAGNRLSASYNKELRQFVGILGMAHLLDHQALTLHRFRKTLARLVALAIAHAPKILLDVFGHKSIKMTLHYIQANPEMLAEIEETRSELSIIMARKAIDNAGSNGGPAATTIRLAVEKVHFRRAVQDFGAETEDDLAMQLTAMGRSWRYVQPMVICTKLDGETGPCQKGKNTPNMARCRRSCEHRLVEPERRAQVDETLAHVVSQIQRGQAINDEILCEIYEGQLLANLREFEDLYEKWRVHPIVLPILRRREEKREHA